MTRLLPFVLLAALGCTAGASTPAADAAAPAVKGTLFIVGGGAQAPALIERFVALAGGPGKARIAVLPMATAYHVEEGKEKTEQLRALGADAYVLDFPRERADDDSIVQAIDRATGIWFSGGDQLDLIKALAGSRALEALHARYRDGAVIGGTSAGAAVMSDSMITGEQVRPGEDTVGYFGDEFPRIARKTIIVKPGLGFLHGAIVDQHFVVRERANRLIGAVLDRPSLIGVGIDEGTVLRVDPDGTWGIEGRSHALVVDARKATLTPPADSVLGATGMTVHLLPAGSRYDPGSGTARLP